MNLKQKPNEKVTRTQEKERLQGLDKRTREITFNQVMKDRNTRLGRLSFVNKDQLLPGQRVPPAGVCKGSPRQDFCLCHQLSV